MSSSAMKTHLESPHAYANEKLCYSANELFILISDMTASIQCNQATVAFWRDQKTVIHLHHFVPHAMTQLRATALPEE